MTKNIFCLEGIWDNNLRKRSSVEPVLNLLHKHDQIPRLNYIHRDCATKSEFEFYIQKWIQRGYDDYPILYLAFHGEEGCIGLSNGSIELSSLQEMLKDKCKNRIIIFASCSTLNIDKRILKTFIDKTDCLAICGYRTDVNWIKATAFELLLIEGMQSNEFSGRGINAIEKSIKEIAKGFKELEFTFVSKNT